MSSALPRDLDLPTQFVYDSSSGRIDVVVDVSPATIDDLAVAAGPRRLRLRIEVGDDELERTFAPPAPELRFDGDREASYNNGVLTVSVGIATDD